MRNSAANVGGADGQTVRDCIVSNVQRFCINDGPGIRTTVFFKGCPLRCVWCHNPEGLASTSEIRFSDHLCHACFTCRTVCRDDAILSDEGDRIDRQRCSGCMLCVEACPYGALTALGACTSLQDLLRVVCRDRQFYRRTGGGITASGGEPLGQCAAVAALFEQCRRLAIHTALDTCGYAPWSSLAAVEGVTDLFLYDLKCIDSCRHREWTGVDNGVILENLSRLCARRRQDVRIRIPLVPGFNDAADELHALVRFVANLRVHAVDILPYHRLARTKYRALGRSYSLEALPDYDPVLARDAALLFTGAAQEVTVGG